MHTDLISTRLLSRDASPPAEPAMTSLPPALKSELHEALLRRLDLSLQDLRHLGDSALRERATQALQHILDGWPRPLPLGLRRSLIIKELLNEALGLGPLEDLLADDSITEIMVISKDLIYIEREGRLHLTALSFSSDAAILAIIERIVTPLGRRIDESSPMVDARLKDGSRVNAITPPLALKGPCLTIRKFPKRSLSVQDLIGLGAMSSQMAALLCRLVRGRQNLVISGGTGSGKTTLLGVLSSFIPPDERIITIEDAAELRLEQPHVVSLESRPANVEGRGEVSIRHLVKNALRMRPDRVVVGECRGGEALDMLQAMNTGHDGSLTTAHANSPEDLLRRLETLVLMSGLDLPLRAIREQIASAINFIVQQRRFSNGKRRVTHITEVLGLDEEGRYRLEPVFLYQASSSSRTGGFQATGYIPPCLKGGAHA